MRVVPLDRRISVGLVLCAVVACEQRPAPAPAPSTPSIAAAAPPPSVEAATPAWDANAPDVVALAAAWEGRSNPAGVDTTGTKLTISRFDVPGWSLVSINTFKHRPAAKSLSLEGGHCSPERFGERVTLRHSDGELPLQAQWFKISGGPFRGLILKAFTNNNKAACIFHLATVPYAIEAGWKPPPKD